MRSSIDVLGIGNAIVDILCHTNHDFVEKVKLNKGSMTLVDAARSAELYDAMGPAIEMSGGSAANTIAGIASLGGKGAFIGKVGDDQLGRIFRHDIRAAGVTFGTAATKSGTSTATCMIFVTPDADRTMNTYLGACVELSPEDIDEEVVSSAQVTYMEGYLWDPPLAKQAFLKAAEIAHGAGRKVSLSLSDPFCVGRYKDEFADLVHHHIDILFANEEEICALYGTNDLQEAIAAVKGKCPLSAITRSEKGSVIVSSDKIIEIDAAPISKVVDTTGAGDLYAAGFLFGYTNGFDLKDCGALGSKAAGEIIGHLGARPAIELRELLLKEIA